MPLGEFIRRNQDQIIGEFSAFARTLIRADSDLTDNDLRDHAKDMLTAVAQDLETEQSRFNKAIDEVLTESMTRYAAETDLYRDQSIGTLSHDLRSPLSAITAGAALLAASASDDQRQARVAARILNSAQRTERMIHDLLDLTRARLGGSIPLTPVPTDLQQLCNEVTSTACPPLFSAAFV